MAKRKRNFNTQRPIRMVVLLLLLVLAPTACAEDKQTNFAGASAQGHKVPSTMNLLETFVENTHVERLPPALIVIAKHLVNWYVVTNSHDPEFVKDVLHNPETDYGKLLVMIRKYRMRSSVTLCSNVEGRGILRNPYSGTSLRKECEDLCFGGIPTHIKGYCTCEAACDDGSSFTWSPKAEGTPYLGLCFPTDRVAKALNDFYSATVPCAYDRSDTLLSLLLQDKRYLSERRAKELAAEFEPLPGSKEAHQKPENNQEERPTTLDKPKTGRDWLTRYQPDSDENSFARIRMRMSVKIKWTVQDLVRQAIYCLFYLCCWLRAMALFSAYKESKKEVPTREQRPPVRRNMDGEIVVPNDYPYPNVVFKLVTTLWFELFLTMIVFALTWYWLQDYDWKLALLASILIAFAAHCIPNSEYAVQIMAFMLVISIIELACCILYGDLPRTIYVIVFVAGLLVLIAAGVTSQKSNLAWIVFACLIIHFALGANYIRKAYPITEGADDELSNQAAFGIVIIGIIQIFFDQLCEFRLLAYSMPSAAYHATAYIEQVYGPYSYDALQIMYLFFVVFYFTMVILMIYGLMSAYIYTDAKFARSAMIQRIIYVFSIVPTLTMITLPRMLMPLARATLTACLEYVLTTALWVIILCVCAWDLLALCVGLYVLDCVFCLTDRINMNLESELRISGLSADDLALMITMTQRIRVDDGNGNVSEGSALAIGKNMFTVTHIGEPSKGSTISVNGRPTRVVNDKIVASIPADVGGLSYDAAVFLRTAESLTQPINQKVFLPANERDLITELAMFDLQRKRIMTSTYIKWENNENPADSNFFYHKFQTTAGSSGSPIFGRKYGSEMLYTVGLHSQASPEADGFGIGLALLPPEDSGIATIYYPGRESNTAPVDCQARRIKATRERLDRERSGQTVTQVAQERVLDIEAPNPPNSRVALALPSTNERVELPSATTVSTIVPAPMMVPTSVMRRRAPPAFYEFFTTEEPAQCPAISMNVPNRYKSSAAAFEKIRSNGIFPAGYEWEKQYVDDLIALLPTTTETSYSGLYNRIFRLFELLRARPPNNEERRQLEESWDDIGQDPKKARAFFTLVGKLISG